MRLVDPDLKRLAETAIQAGSEQVIKEQVDARAGRRRWPASGWWKMQAFAAVMDEYYESAIKTSMTRRASSAGERKRR